MPRYRFVSTDGECDGGIGFLDDEHALDYADRLTASTGSQVVVYDHRGQLVGLARPQPDAIRHDGVWIASAP